MIHFKTDVPFEQFIENQFSHGTELHNLKSIYNNEQTISIYPSTTQLEMGKGYAIHSDGQNFKKMKARLIKEVDEQMDKFTDDVLYIESTIGTFSLSELFPVIHDTESTYHLKYLEVYEEQIKEKNKNLTCVSISYTSTCFFVL